jgi:hypothetical protein
MTDKTDDPDKAKQRERLRIRQTKAEEPQNLRVVRLPDLELARQSSEPPPVVQTIRVFDLADLRVALNRQRSALLRRGLSEADMPEERRQLREMLEARYQAGHRNWPNLLVVRTQQDSPIRTNIAIVGDSIYLGHHLAANWEKGSEDSAVFRAIRDAMVVFTQTGAAKSPSRPGN